MPFTPTGAATYHMGHPGRRSYERPPVNTNEAEAGRSSRFGARGHTAGAIDVAALREGALAVARDEYPHTPDLRRAVPRATVPHRATSERETALPENR